MMSILKLEDDIAYRLAEIAKETEQPFEVVVNEALRRGLAEFTPAVPAI